MRMADKGVVLNEFSLLRNGIKHDTYLYYQVGVCGCKCKKNPLSSIYW